MRRPPGAGQAQDKGGKRERITRELAACILLALSAAGCHRPVESATAITVEHDVAPSPARVGSAMIGLRLTNAGGKPVAGAHIAIEGVMSHAGMGPATGEAKELEPGRYQAPLEFSMAGDWIVLVHLTLSNGEKQEQRFEIKGVRPD